jgi:hypothetical protein
MGANAQTTVPTFTAAQVLTAAQMNDSARTGVPVFATTTTRDAGFGGAGEKTLAEGQLCYLESTDVVQIYDGALWKTLGPITGTSGFGNLAFIDTQQTTASTTYVNLATVGPTVTLTTGTSAFVVFGCWGTDTGNAGNNQKMSVAVSGATTVAASDTWMAFGSEGLNGVSMVSGYLFSTLNAGSNTFTAQYCKSGGSSTAEFTRRFLQVFAL